MKTSLILLSAVLSGSLALAQAPILPRNSPAAGTRAQTNDASPWIELRDIQAKIHPIEEKMKIDADYKALMQQRADAEHAIMNLDQKMREWLKAKLMQDPAGAPLAKRRAELLAKVDELRTANAKASVSANDLGLTSRLGIPAKATDDPAPAKKP